MLASVTAIPPYESGGGSTFRTDLIDTDGGEGAFEQGLLSGGRTATELGRVETHSVRTSGPTDGGRYLLGVSLDSGNLDDVPVALELGIQFLAPGEEVGLTRQAGELATPTPTVAPVETQTLTLDGRLGLDRLADPRRRRARGRADRARRRAHPRPAGGDMRLALAVGLALLAPAPAIAEDYRRAGRSAAAPSTRRAILALAAFRDTLLPSEQLYDGVRLARPAPARDRRTPRC